MKSNPSKSYLHQDIEKASLESKRLVEQAKVFFEYEALELSQQGINAQSILDLGCGNGEYLGLLSRKLNPEFAVGIDRNPNFLANVQVDGPQRIFYQTDFLDEAAIKEIVGKYQPDLITIRFVLQHMSFDEISKFLSMLATFRNGKTRFIFIDVDERETRLFPPNKSVQQLIEQKMEKQRLLGGDRTVAAKLPSMLKKAGFSSIHDGKIIIRAKTIGWEKWSFIYWPILKTGFPEVETKESLALITKGREWFDQGAKNPEQEMEFTYHQFIVK